MPLIANKVAEKDLREWLQQHDWYGRTAEIRELELAAVERPGWVQVFRFSVRAKRQDGGGWEELRGLLRDDERAPDGRQTAVRLPASDEEYDALWASWSANLCILRHRGERPAWEIALLLLAVLTVVTAAAVAVLRGG